MSRRPKYKAGAVVQWQERGYTRYGVVVAKHSLSQRVAYTIVITSPFGQYEGNQHTRHKWAHQLEPVLGAAGKPRRNTEVVTLWKEGKIG